MHKKAIAITIGLCCLVSPALKAEEQLTILKAVYTGGNVQRDVTPVLIKQVRSGQVQFDVSNGPLGGDPCFGKVKSLTVIYRNAGGDFTITASEGERLIIPNSKAIPLVSANQAANQTPANNSSESSPAESKQTASPRLAPDGVFFLLERTRVKTDSGINAYPQGTRVERISESGLNLRVKAGEDEFEIAKSLLTNDLDLAGEQQKTAQGEKAKLAQLEQRQLAEQQAMQKRQAAATAEAEADKAKAEELKNKIANSKRLRGGILQATNKGLLVDCHYTGPQVSSARSMGMEGAPAPDPSDKGRPSYIDGTFWVVGHPKQGKKVDDDYIDVDAYEEGTYSYTSVTGAAKRIKQYRVVRCFD